MPLTDNCKCIIFFYLQCHLPIRVSNLLESKYKRLMELGQAEKNQWSPISVSAYEWMEKGA